MLAIRERSVLSVKRRRRKEERKREGKRKGERGGGGEGGEEPVRAHSSEELAESSRVVRRAVADNAVIRDVIDLTQTYSHIFAYHSIELNRRWRRTGGGGEESQRRRRR